jgi:hypothetical protein
VLGDNRLVGWARAKFLGGIMRRTAIYGLSALIVGFGGGAVASTMFGPDGEFSAFLGKLEWESDCFKPSWPMKAYADEYEGERVAREYETYLACLKSHAAADSQYASERVFEEAAEELEEVNSEGRARGWLK